MAQNGTVAYVTAMPDCSFCGNNGGRKRKAKYDFKTSWGPWAYGCEVHWRTNRAHSGLGIGYGQELKLESERPETTDDDIRRDVEAAVLAGDYDAFEEAIGDRDPAEFL